jgi:hypothetical protein
MDSFMSYAEAQARSRRALVSIGARKCRDDALFVMGLYDA